MFQDQYPEYSIIEEHMRRARVERSLAIRQYLLGLAQALTRPFRWPRRADGLGSEPSGAE